MNKDFGKMNKDTNHKMPLRVVERCFFCNKKFSVHEFRDKLALTEFITSGLCQKCQDETAEEGK